MITGAAAMLPWIGAAFAGCGGLFGWKAWRQHTRRERMRRSVAQRSGSGAADQARQDALLGRLMQLERRLEQGQARVLCPTWAAHASSFAEMSARAGLANDVSPAAFCEMRFRLALLAAIAGCAIGCTFSFELALLLGTTGAILGWRALQASIARRQHERTQAMEEHLPEMLDVMALGMRSGLSFDAALRLYCAHFSSELSLELKRAQGIWEAGLAHRTEALRELARSYGSPALSRVVETWVRSLRFGTSMIDALEAESAQARAAYKAKREERIAKAPVKMMIPTGALILPAMLLLVLGPVLLELMNGGI